MQILFHPGDHRPPPGGSAVTIGAFDGVHLGHRLVVGRLRELALSRGLTSVVVTFDQHPARVVRPESAPLLLTDNDQKLELLAATGVEMAMVVHFDRARSEESAEDFVTEVLVGALDVKVVVVGHDFHFGHGRAGNVELLARMGDAYGFDVVGLELSTAPDGRTPTQVRSAVSSTRIRQLLAAGQVERAAVLLDRPHQVRGTVIRGDERGRLLGFPTANLAVPAEICLPADGVYAGWYDRPDGTRHRAALSVGRRPQFYERAKTSLLEAHLLDFDGDLYGEAAAAGFVARLRAQERFETLDGLIEQMARDVELTGKVLAAGG